MALTVQGFPDEQPGQLQGVDTTCVCVCVRTRTCVRYVELRTSA